MLEMIYKQGRFDVFFIDWVIFKLILKINRKSKEKPRFYLQRKDMNEEEEESVSVWRTLFIANEFNELQPYRYVNSEWTLIFLAFFLKFCKF